MSFFQTFGNVLLLKKKNLEDMAACSCWRPPLSLNSHGKENWLSRGPTHSNYYVFNYGQSVTYQEMRKKRVKVCEEMLGVVVAWRVNLMKKSL